MNASLKTVSSIDIHNERPTEVDMSELFCWVVWQFPRPYHSGYCGAVRPQSGTKNWFPALIGADQRKVQIHGHIKKSFRTPETAAEYLYKSLQKAGNK